MSKKKITCLEYFKENIAEELFGFKTLQKAWNFCASQYDSENASLKSELEHLKKENQELAAQHCSSAVLDEHGNRRCSQTGELI